MPLRGYTFILPIIFLPQWLAYGVDLRRFWAPWLFMCVLEGIPSFSLGGRKTLADVLSICIPPPSWNCPRRPLRLKHQNSAIKLASTSETSKPTPDIVLATAKMQIITKCVRSRQVCLVSVCVCAQTYVHTHMYVCTYVCMCVCVSVCMYVCMYACMHVCMFKPRLTCRERVTKMYVCMYVCA